MARHHYTEIATEKDKKDFAKFLAEGEDLILATGFGQTYLRSVFVMAMMWPGGIFLFGPIILAYFANSNILIAMVAGLVLSCLVALLKAMHVHHSNRYLLTTRRVIIKKGLFAVQVTSALYDKITHIEVVQSFMDKLLMHHGQVVVNTAGMNKGEIVLEYVEHPIEFKNLLERLINREREQFGLRGGPIVTLEGEVV